MASTVNRSAAAANAAADAMAALLNGGYLRLYSGTQPADVTVAVSDQVLLAELRFANPAFGAAVDGVATANAITEDSDANADGDATWYRALKSDGTTAVQDGSVGTSGCDLNMNSVAIRQHAAVQVTGFTITEQMS